MPLDFSFLARTPNFNPAAEEEERRRRLLQGARPVSSIRDGASDQPRPIALPYGAPPLTGTSASPLPDPPNSRPTSITSLTPPIEAPRAIAPRMTAEDLRDYRGTPIQDTTDFQRDQYVRKSGSTDESGKFKAKRPSWKDYAANIALGFLQGAQSDPRNPLMAGLGGAATGGILSAVNPLAAREYRFEQLERPRIEAQMAKEQQQREREREARKASLEEQKALADIDLKETQAKKFSIPTLVRARAPQLKIGRSRDTGAIEYFDAGDPAQRARFEPYERERAEGPPYGTSAQGIYNRQTGEIVTPAPAKPEKPEKLEKPPAAALKAAEGLAQRKQQVSALWQKAREQPQGTEERARAERMAQSALDAYNQAIAQFGELYGEYGFETGIGQGGWGYVKKRKTQPGAKSQGAAPKGQPTANLKDLEKLWR